MSLRRPLVLVSGVPAELPTADDLSFVLKSARVYNSVTIAITNNTLVPLTFNSERWDSDSIHSTVTNTSRLTATTGGLYEIGGTAAFAANAAGTSRALFIQLNGTTLIAGLGTPPVPGGANATTLTIATQYSLAPTDYVELLAFQDTGGGLVINAGLNYSPEFFMTRLGPQP